MNSSVCTGTPTDTHRMIVPVELVPPAGRKFLYTEDLVRIYGIPKTTWQKWRSLKVGPAYFKLGRRPAYRPEDIRIWEERQKIHTD